MSKRLLIVTVSLRYQHHILSIFKRKKYAHISGKATNTEFQALKWMIKKISVLHWCIFNNAQSHIYYSNITSFFNPPRASEELLFLLIFFLSHNISLHQFQPSGLPQGSPSSTEDLLNTAQKTIYTRFTTVTV